ncbi:Uu.00g139390.m01.CDS01 [Anthostomella pinea]|uniref:protein-ribulosamine 3-kinase n=1 Tax=Anthostomella pinea TaxID=933095 RepID=A0AAI8YL59_9PEZI|nr:Uu.00g139390.m01.CDS01 [Anthostomella pinea]
MSSEHAEDAREVDVPVEAIQTVDPAVVANLPWGTHVISIQAHGASFWTRTARVDAERDGVQVAYFLKVASTSPDTVCLSTASGERGRQMMSSEHHCMSKIRAVMHDLVPEPLAWGTYADIPDVHFFLCEFRSMTGGIPDIETFTSKMAKLHSVGTSPMGGLGLMSSLFMGIRRSIMGPSDEIKELMDPFFKKVIPCLLRPLESGGRYIFPSLTHGDLWHGNASMDEESGMPIIFDAASFYAHNEYELGVWRQPWNKINESYRMRYHEHFPPSEPKEDYDDRNALYAT